MAKSIVEKLNLQKYKHAAVLDEPEGFSYFEELTGYDTALKDRAYDLIFAFVLDMESLKELVNRVIEHQHLNENGYLYAAYPKKGNKIYPTFIHRDDLLAGIGSDEKGYIGKSNIKFSRMVGLDDVFTPRISQRLGALCLQCETRGNQSKEKRGNEDDSSSGL